MFGEKLKQFREEKGMTTIEFGRKLGVSATAVCRNERCEGVLSHWRYTRKINAVFGTNFPDISYCKDCGCEIEGCGRLCLSCMENKKQASKKKRRKVSLLSAAKSADEANLHYGDFSAGISVRENRRTNKAPEYLNLGRTITI